MENNKDIKKFLKHTINDFEKIVVERIKQHEQLMQEIKKVSANIELSNIFYKDAETIPEFLEEEKEKLKNLTLKQLELFMKITDFLDKTVSFKSYYNYYKDEDDE